MGTWGVFWMRRGAAIAAVAALGGGGAWASPDLVIERDLTRVVFGGCALDEPLATGQAGVMNIGDTVAELPLGIIDRYTRSLVAAYVPEHLDLLDHGRETTRLAPGETARVPFSIGVGAVKAGRLVDPGAPSPDSPAPLRSRGREAVMAYQQALADLEYYALEIDGLPGPGFYRAVEAFQADIGRAQTGVLTIADAEVLADRAGVALETGAETAPGEVRVTVYVVADPYNLVAEADETNNIHIMTGVIDCSGEALGGE